MNFKKEKERLRITAIWIFTLVLLLNFNSLQKGTIIPVFNTVPLTVNSALYIPLPPPSPALLVFNVL